MKKAGAALLLLISLAAGLVLGWRLNEVDVGGPIDYCFDGRGYLGVLEEGAGGTRLLRFSPDGVLEGAALLPAGEGGARLTYKALEADEAGNLYLLRETYRLTADGAGTPERQVLEETVLMYDAGLTRRRDALTLSHPGGAAESRIRRLAVHGEEVYALCVPADGQVQVLAARAASGGAPYSLTAFSVPGEVYDLAVRPDGSALCALTDGRLYRVADGAAGDVTSALGLRAVPAEFFLDDGGTVCLRERLTGALYAWTGDGLGRVDPPQGWTDAQLARVKAVPGGGYSALSEDGTRFLRFGAGQAELARLRGPILSGFLPRAGLCALAVGAVLGLMVLLLGAVGRVKGLYPRLLLRLAPLCVAGAVAAALGLTAADLRGAENGLRRTLSVGAAEAAQALDALGERGAPLTLRGTARSAALSAVLAETALELRETEGLSCTLTLCQNYAQRWFAALDQTGDLGFVPAPAACETALGGGDPVWAADGDSLAALTALDRTGDALVLELRVSRREALGAAAGAALAENALGTLGLAALLLLALTLLLGRSLRPLAGIGATARAMAAGRFDLPAPAASGELGELADALDRTAQRRREETEALRRRTDAALPLLERELLALGEDGGVRPLCVLYAAFDAGEDFAALRTRLDRMAAAARKNGGCVAACGMGALLALFPGPAYDGVRTVLELGDLFRSQGERPPRTVLDAGVVEIGPAGGTVLAASAAVARCVRLAGLLERSGPEGVITQAALDRLGGDRPLCRRYIGGAEGVRLYELLDGLPYHVRRLRLETRERFEAGVAAREAGDPAGARDCFAAAAARDRGDALAVAYLARSLREE